MSATSKSKGEAAQKALKSNDGGKFFSRAAWKKVRPAAERLLKEKGSIWSSRPTPQPEGGCRETGGDEAAERERSSRSTRRNDARNSELNGIYIFACRNPGFVRVQLLRAGGREARRPVLAR